MTAPTLTADSITATNVVVGTQIVRVEDAQRLPFDLPPLDAPVVGRDAALDAAAAHVRAGTRTLSITGLAGVGKRTFAIALARALAADFPDGQIVADLAGFAPGQPPRAAVDVLRELYPRFRPYGSSVPASEDALRGEFLSALHGRRALVLLTNARDGAQAAKLLPPESCLALITSQAELRLGTSIALAPLAQADAAALLRGGLEDTLDAGQADRLAQLCGQLPAALTFARGYLLDHDLTPAATYITELAARSLADALSIGSLLQVSFDALGEPARAALACLSMMPAAFDRGAACAVAGVADDAITTQLQALKRVNLVDYDRASQRFGIHVLVRDFALARLPPDELARARTRYVTHFQSVGERADAEFRRGGDAMLAGLALFDRERAHIAHALALAAERWSAARTPEAAAQLCAMSDAVSYIGEVRLAAADRQGFLAAELDAIRSGAVAVPEGMTCQRLGNTWLEAGDRARAASLYDAARRSAIATGDARLEAMSLLSVATLDWLDARIDDAAARLDEALDRARQAGARREEGWARYLQAAVAGTRDDVAGALALLDTAGQIAGECGDLWLQSAIANSRAGSGAPSARADAIARAEQLGDSRLASAAQATVAFAMVQSDPRGAREAFRTQVEGARRNNDRRAEATALAGVASAAMLVGDGDEALEQAKRAIELVQAIGDRPSQFWIGLLLGFSSSEREDWDGAIRYFSVALELMPAIGGARGATQVHQGLAQAYAEQGRDATARDHFEQALAFARASSDVPTRTTAAIAYAQWLDARGEAEPALSVCRDAAEVAHAAGDARQEGVVRVQMGLLLQQRDDAAAALAAFSSAAEALEASELVVQRRLALVGATLACYRLQQPAGVIEYGERALRVPGLDPDTATPLHSFVGQAYAATGDATQATSHFERGRALAVQAGRPDLVASFDAQLARPRPTAT